jgi:ABC-2 type transport system permease protein
MRSVLAVARRELYAYFSSPLAYVIITVFLLLCGFYFYNVVSWFALQSMQFYQYPELLAEMTMTEMVWRPLLDFMAVVFLFVVPFLTMRLIAAERRSGTLELVLTSPLWNYQIVLGKFLASLALLGGLVAPTILYVLVLSQHGDPDPAPIACGYLGLILVGSSLLALGLFISSVAKTQSVAAIGGLGMALMFWLVGWSSDYASPTVAAVLKYLSLSDHLDDFAKGVLDTSHLLYYGSLVFLGLFLASRTLEAKRWT